MAGLEWIVALAAVIAGAAGFLMASLLGQKARAKFVQERHDFDLERQHLQGEIAQLEKDMAEQRARLEGFEEEQAEWQSARVRLERLDAQLEAQRTVQTDLERRLASAEHDRNQAQQAAHQAQNELTELTTTLEQRELSFQQQLKDMSETREKLNKDFEVLAAKIFEEKSRALNTTNGSQIESLLKPFREQIEGFQKRVNEVHDSATKDSQVLQNEIKKVVDVGKAMSEEATALASALKGDSQQRGAWGEAQLQRTLEMGGLQKDVHYATQTSFKDDEGKTKITDYLIMLPDGKHMVIDSKVSLVDYELAVNAETPEAAELAMKAHGQAVKKHIDDLASKDYVNLAGIESPNFVLMFMPIEPAYIDALKANKDLFDYGYRKNVVLVSHTTLIPILRTVSNLWLIQQSNENAQQLSDKAGDIFNTVITLATRLEKLGNTLKTAGNHYNEAVKSVAGQQGLYGRVERFSQYSKKVKGDLPLLEPKHIDLETERLALPQEIEPTDATRPTSDEE